MSAHDQNEAIKQFTHISLLSSNVKEMGVSVHCASCNDS